MACKRSFVRSAGRLRQLRAMKRNVEAKEAASDVPPKEGKNASDGKKKRGEAASEAKKDDDGALRRSKRAAAVAGPMFPYFSGGTEEGRKRKDGDRVATRSDSPKRSAAAKARASQEEAKKAAEEESEESDDDAPRSAEDVDEDEEEAEEGIEKILSFKTVTVQDAAPQKEYYVKWKGKSYHKCSWLSEEKVNQMAPHRLRHFKRLFETEEQEPDLDGYKDGVKFDWLEVERVIAQREPKAGEKEYLVKWKELQYNACTWETEAELNTLSAKAEIAQFEKFSNPSASAKGYPTNPEFQKLESQPAYLQGGQLHPYQLEGVNWLRHSWHTTTNVILADEMGLGKTIQTIAFLSCLHAERTAGPFLLVVPLSTLRNWHREFSFWAPHMNVVVYTGSQESRALIRRYEFFDETKPEGGRKKGKHAEQTPKFHALMTSYELVLQDNATLQKFAWESLVVDEAHRLKNNNSRLFQVLKEYDTRHKLLLTGTPLQNNLQELFHLLNFLQPDRFASLEDFEREFSHIDKEEQIARLHKMLAPHLLRRLKEDVMKGLPPKSEFIVRVDFTKLQQQYYMAILTKNKKVLHHNVRGSAQVSLLNIIAELQKCANHPYLFAGAEPNTNSKEESLQAMIEASGKLQLVDKMLSHLKASGHRVLLFSQMTRMLDILEDYLTYRNYDYERIDGQVTGHLRQERIDRFNSRASSSFCFLLSTKAGGLGINLATADTVIIYDSDWNPHNDIQALSRAHRIGQANKVMIYRLVTRYSIEERIIQRSKEKLMLDHLVVRKMGAKGETLLREGELDDILRFGAAKLFGDDVNRDAIRYDDAAVAKLLDRSALGIEEKAAAQNDYLNSFKVAHIETGDKAGGASGGGGGGEKGDGFWEQLLGAQTEMDKNIIQQSEKRSTRKGVRYIEADAGISESDDEWETFPGTEAGSDDDGKPQSSKRHARAKAGDSTVLIDGEGKSARVLGLSSYQRATFLKLLMLHGYGDGTWTHFLGRALGNLRAKPIELLAKYGDLLMHHLLEPVSESPTFADGVPRDGIRPKFVLQRLVVLQLIHNKVKSTPSADAFDINDGGWTELGKVWRETPTPWSRQQDHAYLVGTVKHGYGKWAEIVNDTELGLAVPLQAAVRIAESAKRKDTVMPPPNPKPLLALPPPTGGTALPPLLMPPMPAAEGVKPFGASTEKVEKVKAETEEKGGGEEAKEEEEGDGGKDDEGESGAAVDLATIKFLRNRLALLEKSLHIEYQLKAMNARFAPPEQPTLITAEILLPQPLYVRPLPTPPVMPNTPATLTVLPPQPTAAATARLAFLLAWRELYDFVRHMSANSARTDLHLDAGVRYRRDLKTLDNLINNARDRLRECLKDG